MAGNKKITELDSAAPLDGSENVELVQLGGNVKISVSALKAFLASDNLLSWNMDTNLFPAGSLKGQRYYGTKTTSTLVDINGDPLPNKVIATSLVDGASTTDPAEWAFTYTIN